MAKLVKCEGQLVVKRAGGYENEFFETEFLLSDDVTDAAQARSIIQSGLLNEKLLKDVPQYKNWRECQVVSIEGAEGNNNTSELEQMLLKCSEVGCVPENLSSYGSESSKVKALSKAFARHEARVTREREKEKAVALLSLANS